MSRNFLRYRLPIVVPALLLTAYGASRAENQAPSVGTDVRLVSSDSLPSTASRCVSTSKLFVMAGYSAKNSSNLNGPTGGWISDLAGDHFTIAGPYYPQGSDWLDSWMEDELADAVRYDLCLAYTIAPRRTVADEESPKFHGPVGTAIVSVPHLNFYGDDEVTDASDEQMDIWIADVEDQIQTAVADPARNERIALWAIMPEEMRYWRPKEQQQLQRMHEAVKRYDPLQRPTMMYEPQHALAQRLEQTLPYQDIVAVGSYPHVSGNDHRRIHVRHTVTQILRAIELSGSTALPAPVLEMFEDQNHPYDLADVSSIPRFVRHDAYSAFANGARGLIVFSMGRRAGFATYSLYYDAWARVARELSKLRLRDVFLKGKPLGKARARVTSGEKEIRFQWVDGIDETYPSTSVRDWSYNGRRYVLAVNSLEGAVRFTLGGLRNGVYRDLFTGRRRLVTRHSLDLSLPPLGVTILRR